MQVRDVMKSPVIAVAPDDTVAETALLLSEERISGAPVIDEDGQLVGLISEKDLVLKSQQLSVRVFYDVTGWISPQTPVDQLARFTQGLCTLGDMQVSDIMKRKVLTVGSADSLEHAARLMAKSDVDRLPVLDGPEMVGIISRADLVWAMVHLCGTDWASS